MWTPSMFRNQKHGLSIAGGYVDSASPLDVLDDVLGYFKLDTDTTWADSKGYFPSFTEFNSITLGTGINGNCASFPGSATLTQGDDAKWNFVSTGFSFNMWINRNVGSELSLIRRTDSASAGWGIVGGAPGTFSWICFNDPAASSSVTSGAITDSAWHMIAVGWNQSNKKPWISVDGAAKTEGTALANTLLDFADNVILGNYPGSTYQGRIDEFMIWNRTIFDDEIAALFNSGAGLFL